MRQFYVYVLASRSRRLYVGVTNDLERRLAEHRSGMTTHTSRYRITRLVHFEVTENVKAAIAREKEIKAWRREKRVALIQSSNPAWDDLAEELFGEGSSKADPSSLRSSG
ncbi:MAG TPA: GIY-YIG nuclease family protein [Gemmatimonadaceae bacterium]|jgi:putative endonuclease